ncbi:glycosyltransferase family 4 protein [Candidatus Gracilibacteria bacterium]|nr:glycosyltransferase family 4 protein [Candidatus Gracilibacteria bacterium]
MESKIKKHIIQILPYFPPHIGGLEKVGEDIFLKWTYGQSYIYSGNMCQELKNTKSKKPVYNDGFKTIIDNDNKIFFPSYEIIDNFPIPLFWTKDFWSSLGYINSIIKKIKNQKDEEVIIITHTRFFVSSLLGGYIARRNKIKWVHIEHGSDYVLLSSSLKNKIAYIYDRLIGKWILKNADTVLAISEASKKFILQEFGRKDVTVWYRGTEFPEYFSKNILKNMFPNKKIIGYVGRLYTWKNVGGLCEAYLSLPEEILNSTQLVIVGTGEDFKSLTYNYKDSGIYFSGGVDYKDSLSYQSEFDIHVHPSSPGGGLATTLLQAMKLGCLIVATPYEGAKEVIRSGENGILLSNDSVEELKRGLLEALSGFKYRNTYAQRNTEILQDQFDMDKNIKKLFKLI